MAGAAEFAEPPQQQQPAGRNYEGCCALLCLLQTWEKKKVLHKLSIPLQLDMGAVLVEAGLELPDNSPLGPDRQPVLPGSPNSTYELAAVLIHKGTSASHGHYGMYVCWVCEAMQQALADGVCVCCLQLPNTLCVQCGSGSRQGRAGVCPSVCLSSGAPISHSTDCAILHPV